jgi:ERCC4-related helicase
VLALFRLGHSNTLFTTSVAEEGLDVQHCSLVICYDVPNRPLSLVQTVGRARARDARVVFMEEVSANGIVQSVRMAPHTGHDKLQCQLRSQCLVDFQPSWNGPSA